MIKREEFFKYQALKDQKLASQIEEKNPSLVASTAYHVEGATLLFDVGHALKERIDPKFQLMQLNETANKNIHVLDSRELTKKLLDALSREEKLFAGKNVLVVYPGAGAKSLKRHIEAYLNEPENRELKERFGFLLQGKALFVPARREMKGKTPRAVVQKFKTPAEKFDAVLVVDDVISSGETAEKLRSVFANEEKALFEEVDSHLRIAPVFNEWISAGRLARIPYYFATWLLPAPKPKSEMLPKLSGYNKVFAGALLAHPAGEKPPINSVSTLIARGKKSAVVRNTWAKRHLESTGLFARTLAKIRKSVDMEAI